MYKFEVYKDKKGEFRFRFRARNGEPMFASEGYKTKASVTKAIDSIKKNAPGAETVDMTAAAKPAAAKPAAKAAAKPAAASAAAAPATKAKAEPKAKPAAKAPAAK
ncbi:MAG TPA: YegP family protein [Rhizobiales bacterium]|nr:YegP family protein [Hyphomicrobiales bacterium]